MNNIFDYDESEKHFFFIEFNVSKTLTYNNFCVNKSI